MHVKFILNGNGFHYGRAIASYLPLHTFDEFTKDRSFFIEDIVEASQRPHIYLDPTKSQGGTLDLPFVWEANALDIPDQEWRDMGDIIIHGMQNLKHANGATDSVTISVFAWATDVVLSIPTANEPGALSPQCGEYEPQADEYGSGPISRPATIIARAAGALSNAPGIGLYAKATQLAASAVASIATAFGYSRPAIISDIVPFRPTYAGNMSNSNVPDSTTKLTLDCKQELTIDTRTFGLDGTDEMTLTSIATRESWLTSFGWTIASTPETLLWNTEVNPVIWNQNTIAGKIEYHMPACCFAALPFRQWRGTMKFRFQIVCSAYHKGRLKVVYDPSYPLTNEYNTNYTHIIDIAKERDFTVEVGWGQQWPFLEHKRIVNNGQNIWSDTALGSDPGKLANGILSVYVVNELTVPNSTTNNDIEVNVFVSAGDDFEVANPDDFDLESITWFAPQAGEYDPQAGALGEHQPDADDTQMESAPLKEITLQTMGPDLTCRDHTLDVFFGDPIVSFRQCLKRYNYFTSLFPVSSGVHHNIYTLSNFPFYVGRAPGAVHFCNEPSRSPYNFCKMTLLNYVAPAFTCRRGGIRWKYVSTFTERQGTSYAMVVDRDPSATFVYSAGEVPVVTVNNSVSQKTFGDVDFYSTLWSGGHVTAMRQNPTLEVEIPYFDETRFAMAKQANQTSTVTRTFYHNLYATSDAAITDYSSIKSYVSVGEDFTLGFYTGPPVAYAREAVTPAV